MSKYRKLKNISIDIQFIHIQHFLSCRNHSISPVMQLLLALRFYATGSFLITAGDVIGVSQSAASNIVKRVSFAIARLAPQYINMPTMEADLLTAKTAFYHKARLPRVIGSLDCTHIKIQSPGK